jgi:hypothetical protein
VGTRDLPSLWLNLVLIFSFSLGLTFAIGMPYTPMHAILPFLYLGKSSIV